MSKGKRIKVIGGLKETREEGEGKNKKTWTVFTEKKSVVVEERNLAALFRRDAYLCGLPVIKITETRERCTPGLFFSELPIDG
jgi:hypothetical protein